MSFPVLPCFSTVFPNSILAATVRETDRERIHFPCTWKPYQQIVTTPGLSNRCIFNLLFKEDTDSWNIFTQAEKVILEVMTTSNFMLTLIPLEIKHVEHFNQRKTSKSHKSAPSPWFLFFLIFHFSKQGTKSKVKCSILLWSQGKQCNSRISQHKGMQVYMCLFFLIKKTNNELSISNFYKVICFCF